MRILLIETGQLSSPKNAVWPMTACGIWFLLASYIRKLTPEVLSTLSPETAPLVPRPRRIGPSFLGVVLPKVFDLALTQDFWCRVRIRQVIRRSGTVLATTVGHVEPPRAGTKRLLQGYASKADCRNAGN